MHPRHERKANFEMQAFTELGKQEAGGDSGVVLRIAMALNLPNDCYFTLHMFEGFGSAWIRTGQFFPGRVFGSHGIIASIPSPVSEASGIRICMLLLPATTGARLESEHRPHAHSLSLRGLKYHCRYLRGKTIC